MDASKLKPGDKIRSKYGTRKVKIVERVTSGGVVYCAKLDGTSCYGNTFAYINFIFELVIEIEGFEV